jgi:uncharacterized protein (DUF1499 family)
MRHLLKQIVLVALAVAVVLAITHWPRLDHVETGRTPEYPDLRVRDYGASEEKVVKAARAAIAALPRWTPVGGGKGPGGAEIQAEVRMPVLGLTDDVFIRVRRQDARTTVNVLSRSRSLKWDFGQNARNIEAFLKELDRQMFVP